MDDGGFYRRETAYHDPLPSTLDKQLTDNDYTLAEGRAWFTVKGFSVRIAATDEGVAVEIYDLGEEAGEPLASCWALDAEAEEQGEAQP